MSTLNTPFSICKEKLAEIIPNQQLSDLIFSKELKDELETTMVNEP